MPVEPWQGGPQPYRGPSGPNPWQQGPVQPWQHGMRAAQADRDRTVDVLRAAYGEGRLDAEEHERRTQYALEAKTYGELSQLIADLPTGPFSGPMAGPPVMGPMQAVPDTFRPAQPARTNSMAVGALICGLVQPFCFGASAIPAIILGHVSKSQIRRSGEEGDGMATAGLVLGWLGIAFWMMVFFFAASMGWG